MPALKINIPKDLCKICEKWLGCTTRKKLNALCGQFDLVLNVKDCRAFEEKV